MARLGVEAFMRKKALVGLAAALALAGCTPEWARQNDSNLIMVISQIEGESGASGDSGSVLLSDVAPVFNDIATVTVRVTRKSPLEDFSVNEAIQLTRYEVRYFRTDARNQEGVDVPYRITGPLSALVPAPAGGGSIEVSVPIDVVRHQAKLEPPLLLLREFTITDPGSVLVGGAGVLTAIAEITVYGVTINDRELKATGQLQITFANFAD